VEAGLLELVEAGEFGRRHLGFFAGQDFVHLAGGGEGAVEDEMGEVLLVFEGVGLGQDAAATVAEERDFAQVKGHAHVLDVFDHGLDGIFARVLKALGTAGAALVDEDEAVGAGQREQVRQKVSVVGAGSAMDDDQRGACAEGHVIDEHAVGVDKTFLLGINGGSGLGGYRLGQEGTHNRHG